MFEKKKKGAERLGGVGQIFLKEISALVQNT